jgi:hypothetical protein
MDQLTLTDINNNIESIFKNEEDGAPQVMHLSTIYFALDLLIHDIELTVGEYDNILPEDVKNRLADIHYKVIDLQNCIK